MSIKKSQSSSEHLLPYLMASEASLVISECNIEGQQTCQVSEVQEMSNLELLILWASVVIGR